MWIRLMSIRTVYGIKNIYIYYKVFINLFKIMCINENRSLKIIEEIISSVFDLNYLQKNISLTLRTLTRDKYKRIF